MLYIKKNPVPKSISEKVIEIKATPGWRSADEKNTELIRSFFDLLDKPTLRESLVREQHGLCAYCMRRIERDREETRIEHWRPIKGNKDAALDYRNMHGCCSGGSDIPKDRNKVLCCDVAKEDQSISLDPQDKEMMSHIRYSKDGFMRFDPPDERKQKEINEILKLNGELNEDGTIRSDTSTQIVKGRRDAYRSYECLMRHLDRRFKGDQNRINKEIENTIRGIEESDVYPEYAGVQLYFLKRRLHRQ